MTITSINPIIASPLTVCATAQSDMQQFMPIIYIKNNNWLWGTIQKVALESRNPTTAKNTYISIDNISPQHISAFPILVNQDYSYKITIDSSKKKMSYPINSDLLQRALEFNLEILVTISTDLSGTAKATIKTVQRETINAMIKNYRRPMGISKLTGLLQELRLRWAEKRTAQKQILHNLIRQLPLLIRLHKRLIIGVGGKDRNGRRYYKQ
jgi:hypothetical protein